MDFFKSVFSADPEPSDPPRSPSKFSQEPEPFNSAEEEHPDQDQHPSTDQNPSPIANSWSLGVLVKTLTTKSESVLQTYRRDLDEFASGLKKETAIFREAIKDLPVSLETGASAAQESLESVGHAIDEFGSSVWRGTTEIISQGKDAFASDQESDSSDAAQNYGNSGLNTVRYSRFEAQVHAIQADLNTYCEDPEDLDDFEKWRSGFSLEEKAEEIGNLCDENGVMEGVYGKLVPSVVNHETFWFRYFYKFYKLKLVEDARVNLVKRAISREDEEELSWEVDDDYEEDSTAMESKNVVSANADADLKDGVENSESVVENKAIEVLEEESSKSEISQVTDKGSVAEPISNEGSVEKESQEGKVDSFELDTDDSASKSNEKVLEGKMSPVESCKDSDFSVVMSQQSFHDEDDMGWDEIEDLGSNDEKKESSGGTPNKIDLRKRLSAAEEEEDLSWDIEDDEPVKQ